MGDVGGDDDALCVEVEVVGYIVQWGCPFACQGAAKVMGVSGGVGCHVPPEYNSPQTGKGLLRGDSPTHPAL